MATSPKSATPIHEMKIDIAEKHTPFSVTRIAEIADRASSMLTEVRDLMAAPNPKKVAPTYTTGSLAALCGLNKNRLTYLMGINPDLPQGEAQGQGRSKVFTLVEARQIIAKIGQFKPRPKGTKAKKIAICMFKGGVSKTTTAQTLGQGLSLRGRRVLLVDLDPQGSLTALNGILSNSEVEPEQTVLPLIEGAEPDLRYAVQSTYWDGVDLIPSSPAVFSAEFTLPVNQMRNKGYEFWDIINAGLEPLLDDYDVVIIDTPPALSYLTINAFMAADGVIVPTPPNALDYASSTQFWRLMDDIISQVMNNRPDMVKDFDFVNILLSKVDAQLAATPEVTRWITKTYDDMVLPCVIPMTTVTNSASAEFGTVYDISKYEGAHRTYLRARESYDQLAAIIDGKLIRAWNRGSKES